MTTAIYLEHYLDSKYMRFTSLLSQSIFPSFLLLFFFFRKKKHLALMRAFGGFAAQLAQAS